MLLVFRYNSTGLIENSNLEPLPLESDYLIIAPWAFHICCYNYSSFSSISQPNKIILFPDFTTNYVKILLKITAALLQSWQKSAKLYGKINAKL